jgi:predicted membrane channel-forming protein YqfA (hemolysin III family)
MPKRSRKFVGALVMISFVVVYALVAMALAQSRIVREAPGLLQALYYVVLGMAWVLPMMPLIKWMERPDRA